MIPYDYAARDVAGRPRGAGGAERCGVGEGHVAVEPQAWKGLNEAW